MGETLSTILTYGFIELGLHRIEANPLAENTRSRSLLIKISGLHLKVIAPAGVLPRPF
jgi:RimJ/RimL family protein N-acetyltransferase